MNRRNNYENSSGQFYCQDYLCMFPENTKTC